MTMSSCDLSSWISCWYRAIRLDWSMISFRATLTSMRFALRLRGDSSTEFDSLT
jgi:hypothetical protein